MTTKCEKSQKLQEQDEPSNISSFSALATLRMVKKNFFPSFSSSSDIQCIQLSSEHDDTEFSGGIMGGKDISVLESVTKNLCDPENRKKEEDYFHVRLAKRLFVWEEMRK